MKRTHWLSVSIACLCGLLSPALEADLLLLADGREVEGSLRKVEADSIRFQPVRGELETFSRQEVSKVELHRDLGGTTATRVEDLEDPLLKQVLRYQAGPEDYPDSGAANLYLGYQVRFDEERTKTETVRNIVRVLRERGKEEGTVYTQTLDQIQTADLDFGRTYLPDGSLLSLTEKGTRTSRPLAGLPGYDHLGSTLYTLPGVDVGSVVDWQTTTVRRGDASAFPPFFRFTLEASEPILQGRVELRIHRQAGLKVWVSKRDGLPWEIRDEGPYQVHRFDFRGLNPPPTENSRPGGEELFPTIYVTPEQGLDLSAAEFAQSLEGAVRPGTRTKALLASLLPTRELSRSERFWALSEWVLREIRLVGVPLYLAGYRPQNLEELLAKKMANPLDKTVVLYGLLKAAGIETRLFLARDSLVPEPMPGPESFRLFNQALLAVKLEEGWVYRAIQEAERGPDALSPAFEGAPILQVSAGDKLGELSRVPPLPEEADSARLVYRTRLDADGTLEGTRILEVRGHPSRTVRSYRNLSKELLEKRMSELNHAFHPLAELLGYELEHLDDFTQDVLYKRHFRVPRYALRAGGSLLAFQVPGLVDQTGDVSLPNRALPLAYSYPDEMQVEIEVELPRGFRVFHRPEDLLQEGPGYRNSAQFSVEDGVLRYRGEHRRWARRIPVEEYPSYKAAREERARLAEQWVLLEATSEQEDGTKR